MTLFVGAIIEQYLTCIVNRYNVSHQIKGRGSDATVFFRGGEGRGGRGDKGSDVRIAVIGKYEPGLHRVYKNMATTGVRDYGYYSFSCPVGKLLLL